ncbi:MAG: DNA polymerase ligase N-terminal domain-containing protein [Planctomycetota bacterium]
MPDRFVILHHRLDHGEHWDLMLESGDVLLTWQLLRDPTDPAGYPIPARRIGDHRKAYLTYEGPLSRNRGTVRRVDSGAVEFEETTPQYCRFMLGGRRLGGMFLLRQDAQGWTFEAAGGP